MASSPTPSSAPARDGGAPSRRAARRTTAAGPGRAFDEALVDCAVYAGGRRHGGSPHWTQAREQAAGLPGGFVWVGLHEPSADALAGLAEALALPPLAVEDAVAAHQRPKLEEWGDELFLVLKTVRYVDSTEVIATGELMLYLGRDFVVTVRHGEASALADVRHDLESRPELLSLGPSAVLYAVVDRVVDGYAPAMDEVERDIDEIEDQVFSGRRGTAPTQRIYSLKREVLEFRRAVEPLQAATSSLSSGAHSLVAPELSPYLRDVHEHVVRAGELVAGADALLSDALSSNLAQVSMRQNDDMRKISAWVAIAGVCTLIAGVYGMNFDEMPELRWALGYPFALSLMALSSLVLYRGFRRNGWL